MENGNSLTKMAWEKRTTLVLTTAKWKRVTKKQPVWVMADKHIYEIKVEAVNKKKLNALMAAKKKIERLIAKEVGTA